MFNFIRTTNPQHFLAINNYSYAFFLVDFEGKEIIEDFIGGAVSKQSLMYVNDIMRAGYMNTFFDGTYETHPNVINFSITEKCNLECDYCFYSASYKNNKKLHNHKLTDASILSDVFHGISNLSPHARVIITGGEPFMNADIFKYATIIRGAGLSVGVLTNGTLINEKIIKKIKLVGFSEVRISLDGYDKDSHEKTRPNTYKKILENIIKLKSHGVNVIISSTITSYNQKYISSILHLAKDIGVGFNYSPMVPTGRGKSNQHMLPNYNDLAIDIINIEQNEGILFSDHIKPLKVKTCGLAGNSIYINAEGDVYPCNMLKMEEFKLGNVSKKPLNEILNSDMAKSIRISVDEIDVCNSCAIRYYCGGVCRASALNTKGSMFIRNSHCGLKYNETIHKLTKSATRFFYCDYNGSHRDN